MLRLSRLAFAAVAIAGCFQLDLGSPTQARAFEGFDPIYRPHEYGQPDLFYNFYVPAQGGGVPAQMYIAPGPVPPHVGHTYYTYQPMMPHELLYKHKRTYHRYYDEGRGLTRTHIRWW